MKKALFLTFDKTLITSLSGREHYLHTEDWKFINQTVEAIKDFESRGYYICIISNQDSVADGLVSENNFLIRTELVLTTLEKLIKGKKYSKDKEKFIKYSYCIDASSYNYLPNPGMIYELAIDFEIDIINSVLIGNSIYDRAICKYSGIGTYLDITDLNYSL